GTTGAPAGAPARRRRRAGAAVVAGSVPVASCGATTVRGAVLSGSATTGGVNVGAPAGAPARRRRRAGGGFCGSSDESFSGSWVLSAIGPSPSGGPAHPGPVWSSSLRTEVPSPRRRAAPLEEALRCRPWSTAVAVVRVADAPTPRRREVPPPGTEQESAS